MAVLWCRDDQLILEGERAERRPFEAADATFLEDQGAAYARALRLATPAGTLLAIGKALHDWLDRKDLLSPIIGESGPVALELAVAARPDAGARAFVAAPWELLTDAAGLHLAFDATRAYSPVRRLGAAGTPQEPAHRDLSVLFMAAAPEGVSDLDYEREEALILEAVERLPVHLAVEESGSLAPLADRLALEGPFEVLHLTGHGDLAKGRGLLALEDDAGGLDPVAADRLCGTLGSHLPPLVLLSACRTAEQAGAAVPLALDLMQAGAAQVIGWAGSVYDADAIAFARALYGALGRRESVPAAAASARRALVQALQGDPEGGVGRHWHLARVHLGPGGGGPLCANGKPARPRPLGDKPFLDRKQQVPVAAPAVYVGRRREAQAVLRAFSGIDGPAGVLVRGMGRLGKSSLAARVARRRRDLRSAVVFGRYDARAIFGELVEAVEARHRAALRAAWQDEIARDPRALKDAVEAILTGPAAAPDKAAGHQPILLVIDDLERVLEPPKPGDTRTLVKAEIRAPLRAVLDAFAAVRTVTESRLLLTSRYAFSLPGARDDCADALLDLQLPPLSEGQRRKLARAELSRHLPEAEIGKEVAALAGRALAAAAGNPGLQALLTRPIPTDPATAEGAIAAVETYVASGEWPAGDVGQFFSELALTAYRAALTAEEIRTMRAAHAFRLPVPRAVMETAAGVLGVPDPARALDRLIGLGCLDVFRNGETTDVAVNALAAPLFAEPGADELAQVARAVVPALAARWRDDEGGVRKGREAFELLRLAEAAADMPVILVEAATAAAAWAWFAQLNARAGLNLVQQALAAGDLSAIPSTFLLLQIGIECAARLGDGVVQDDLIKRGLSLVGDSDRSAQARFLVRRGDRLRQKGQVAEAEQEYRHASDAFAEMGDVRSRAVTLGHVADVLFTRGDLDEVLRLYRDEMLPIFERLGDVRERATTVGHVAEVLFARGSLDEALHLHRDEVLPTFERLGDVHACAVTLGHVADVLFVRGDLNEALRLYRDELLPTFERLGDVHARAVTLGKIADVLRARGELNEALRLYRDEVLPTFERLGDVHARAMTLGYVAEVLFVRGELDEALRLYRDELLPTFERLGDVHSRAAVLGKVADVLFARGSLDEALRLYRDEVLPTFERLGDVHACAVTLGHVADVLFARGDLDEALLIRREEELPVYERLGDLDGQCKVRFNLAKTRLALDITDQESAQSVMDDLAEAYRLAEHLGRAEAIAVIGGLFGQVLNWAGATAEAATVLGRAASTNRKLGQEAAAVKIDALIATLPQPPDTP